MQTQQLQQNMKEKVKVFEDGGIRLLKKGQKGLVHAIFSRFGLVLVLLLLQFGALFSLLRWFGQLLPHYLGGTALVTAAMVVYLLNIDMDNSVRITWLVVIAVLPVLGVAAVLVHQGGHRPQRPEKAPDGSGKPDPRPAAPAGRGGAASGGGQPRSGFAGRATCGGGAAASRCTAIPL